MELSVNHIQKCVDNKYCIRIPYKIFKSSLENCSKSAVLQLMAITAIIQSESFKRKSALIPHSELKTLLYSTSGNTISKNNHQLSEMGFIDWHNDPYSNHIIYKINWDVPGKNFIAIEYDIIKNILPTLKFSEGLFYLFLYWQILGWKGERKEVKYELKKICNYFFKSISPSSVKRYRKSLDEKGFISYQPGEVGSKTITVATYKINKTNSKNKKKSKNFEPPKNKLEPNQSNSEPPLIP